MSQHPFNPDFSPLCVMIARDLIRQGIPLTNGIAVTISVAKTGNDGDPVDLRSIERVSQGRLSLDLSAEQGQRRRQEISLTNQRASEGARIW